MFGEGKMAATAEKEKQMNLAALQQRDPYISSISDSASQVAVYTFNANSNEWEKTDIEGTLFVYTRSAFPINGFMIINRLGLNDLIEPINKKLEFQLQDPFLLYRTAKGNIYGIWFYDRDECARLGQLMNSLVQVASVPRSDDENGAKSSSRARRASESDTVFDVVHDKNVDILQMLSKAQDEYDKTKGQGAVKSIGPDGPVVSNGFQPNITTMPLKADSRVRMPKLNPPASASAKQLPIVRPTAVRAGTSPLDLQTGANLVQSTSAGPASKPHRLMSSGSAGNDASVKPLMNDATPSASTQISLDTLFKGASRHCDNSSDINLMRPAATGGIQEIAGHQKASTLEEIERSQIRPNDAADGDKPLFSMMSASSVTRNLESHQPESPNTVLRRTLNIAPPTPADTGQQISPVDSHVNTFQPVKTSWPDLTVSLQRPADISTAGGDDVVKVDGMMDHLHGDTASCLPAAGLITPESLLQTHLTMKADTVSQHLSSAASVLISPMEFQAASSAGSVSNNVFPRISDDVKELPRNSVEAVNTVPVQGVSPLTKEQLQQAFIYLLQNDSSFLNAIHTAYVNSGRHRVKCWLGEETVFTDQMTIASHVTI